MQRDNVLNHKHAMYPERGYYWSEMLCPVLVVLKVTDTQVVFCKTKKPVGKDYWTWDLSKKDILPRLAFFKYLQYETLPKCWCDVNPKAHIELIEQLEEEDFEGYPV